MTNLRVLVYGTLDAGVTDALRVGIFREPLGVQQTAAPLPPFDEIR